MTRTILISLLLSVLTAVSAAQQPTAQKIESLAGKALSQICSSCTFEVEARWIPDRLSSVDTSAITGLQLPVGTLPRGYQTVSLEMSPGTVDRPVSVQIHIAVSRDLPVVTRRVLAGESLTAELVAVRRVDITRMNELPLFGEEEWSGKAASRLIRKGEPIYPSAVGQPSVVEPGDLIHMVYETGGMSVKVPCTARQSRAAGEQIRLYSKETGKTYIGTLIDSSNAIWERTL